MSPHTRRTPSIHNPQAAAISPRTPRRTRSSPIPPRSTVSNERKRSSPRLSEHTATIFTQKPSNQQGRVRAASQAQALASNQDALSTLSDHLDTPSSIKKRKRRSLMNGLEEEDLSHPLKKTSVRCIRCRKSVSLDGSDLCIKCQPMYHKCKICPPQVCLRPVPLFEDDAFDICQLEHSNFEKDNVTIEVLNIDKGIDASLRIPMKKVYSSYLMNVNATAFLMSRPGYEYYSDLQEQIRKELDPIFHHLEVPFKSPVNESRFCALAWKGRSKSNNPSPQKRSSRSSTNGNELLGFVIIVWDKFHGSIYLQNFAWRTVISEVYRYEHMAQLVGGAVQYCLRLQKSLQRQAILEALEFPKFTELIKIGQIPTWMYIQAPPPIRYVETLVRELHSHQVKALTSLGFEEQDNEFLITPDSNLFQKKDDFLWLVYYM